MKRLLTTTVCSIPLALASVAYAQTTPPPPTEAPQTETPTPGMPGAPGAPETTGTPGTTGAPGTPGTPGDAGTMGTAPPSPMDRSLLEPDAGDTTETITGWSVKNSVIGQSVYNENDEKVGDVTDVVIESGGNVTHIVVGAGGFLGMGQHDVAVPFNEIQRGSDRMTLSGYTKDQLKALPRVELAE